jgi:pseudouridine kinase
LAHIISKVYQQQNKENHPMKDFLTSSKHYVSIIGGSNIDIGGAPINTLIKHDSNPGFITFSVGGVARNVAENAVRLGIKAEFITAIGNDFYGQEIQQNCRKNNISISDSLIDSSLPTSIYLFILNEKKDMEVAISDMAICNKLNPEFIATKLDLINQSSLCFIDTNLNENTIQYILDNVAVPIFIDCVSTTKAKKLQNHLAKIHSLKCNKIEAETLSGVNIVDEESIKKTAAYFIKQGVKQIFITLGEYGVYYANNNENGHIPSIKTNIANTTGTGDSFMGALIYSYFHNLSTMDSAINGVIAASITLQSKKTVSEELNAKQMLPNITLNTAQLLNN